MQSRHGFARLLPLMTLTGLAAGTLALLASARQVQAPAPVLMLRPVQPAIRRLGDGGCSEVPAPVPSHGIIDADGHSWDLAEIPDHTLRGLDLRNAHWFGVDLEGATFLYCNFRGADLREADLRGNNIRECDFTGAHLRSTNMAFATFDRLTRWPAGFDPRSHGARLVE